MKSRTFHVKRRRGHGFKPGELRARWRRRWLAFKARSDARAEMRKGVPQLAAIPSTTIQTGSLMATPAGADRLTPAEMQADSQNSYLAACEAMRQRTGPCEHPAAALARLGIVRPEGWEP